MDPFEQYDDATLNDALRAVAFERNTEAGSTLDTPVSSGRLTFSVGQRQLLSLARAIARGSKLIIFEEASSALGAFQLVLVFYIIL